MTTVRRILVPHDFSDMSEAARSYAAGLAEAFGATVDVLHVTERTRAELPFSPGFVVRPGSPPAEIIRFAKDRESDVIVMGTHGRGAVAHTLLGSFAARVVRTAPCPVLTLRLPRREFHLSNVLVAVDFGAASRAALAYGGALSRICGAQLHLLHVTENYFLSPIVADPHALELRAEAQLSEWLADTGVRVRDARLVIDVSDTPAEVIADYARRADIDLVVMGTHGRRTMERLLIGSVAERIVRTAPCPVLTVHEANRVCAAAHQGTADVRRAKRR